MTEFLTLELTTPHPVLSLNGTAARKQRRLNSMLSGCSISCARFGMLQIPGPWFVLMKLVASDSSDKFEAKLHHLSWRCPKVYSSATSPVGDQLLKPSQMASMHKGWVSQVALEPVHCQLARSQCRVAASFEAESRNLR
ncbi:MAG: hypothetical protein R3D67_10785 [Hyphomicrobiaceae bacterium]